MSFIFVVGPWGSGTSAVAGVLVALGCYGMPPYFYITDDSRTPETYESESFRNVLVDLLDERTLARRKTSDAIVDALTQFRSICISTAPPSNRPIMLKHPLSAMFLPDIEAVFKPKYLLVDRSPERIEATRQRRGWAAHFGPNNVAKLQIAAAEFGSALAASRLLRVNYEELIEQPALVVPRIAYFAGLTNQAQELTAIATLRR